MEFLEGLYANNEQVTRIIVLQFKIAWIGERFVINNSDYPFDEIMVGDIEEYRITNEADFKKFIKNIEV